MSTQEKQFALDLPSLPLSPDPPFLCFSEMPWFLFFHLAHTILSNSYLRTVRIGICLFCSVTFSSVWHSRCPINISRFIQETVEAFPVMFCIVNGFSFFWHLWKYPTPHWSKLYLCCLSRVGSTCSLGQNFSFVVSNTMFISRPIPHSPGWCSWIQAWRSYTIIFLDYPRPDFLGMPCDVPEKTLDVESRDWSHGGVTLLVPLGLHQNPGSLGIQ